MFSRFRRKLSEHTPGVPRWSKLLPREAGCLPLLPSEKQDRRAWQDSDCLPFPLPGRCICSLCSTAIPEAADAISRHFRCTQAASVLQSGTRHVDRAQCTRSCDERASVRCKRAIPLIARVRAEVEIQGFGCARQARQARRELLACD